MRSVDWILLVTSGLLLVAGPGMALQEWTHHDEQRGLAELSGQVQPLEPGFRSPWRVFLLVSVVVAGVAGTLVAVRIARQPKVRSVSSRLLWLLLSGMTLLDFAFLADGMWFVEAPYALRGATIVWLYPLAGILMGGSVMRLTELEDAFGGARA